MRNQIQRVVPGSIEDVARKQGITLQDAFAANVKVMVLCDTSSSMWAEDARGGRARIDVADEELARIQANHPGQVAVVSFSSQVVYCPNGIPERQFAFTDMAAALEFALPADKAGIKTILISDGEPDSQSAALAAARKFTLPLDTVFIGPEGDPGAEFLRQLARLTRGNFGQSAEPGLLADPVERLLLAGGK